MALLLLIYPTTLENAYFTGILLCQSMLLHGVIKSKKCSDFLNEGYALQEEKWVSSFQQGARDTPTIRCGYGQEPARSFLSALLLDDNALHGAYVDREKAQSIVRNFLETNK